MIFLGFLIANTNRKVLVEQMVLAALPFLSYVKTAFVFDVIFWLIY